VSGYGLISDYAGYRILKYEEWRQLMFTGLPQGSVIIHAPREWTV
jgi:hypothetical protein